MANRWGNSDSVYFGGAPKSLQMMTAAMKLKDAYDQPRKKVFSFLKNNFPSKHLIV